MRLLVFFLFVGGPAFGEVLANQPVACSLSIVTGTVSAQCDDLADVPVLVENGIPGLLGRDLVIENVTRAEDVFGTYTVEGFEPGTITLSRLVSESGLVRQANWYGGRDYD